MTDYNDIERLKDEDPYDFEDLFISELDSWFSSDIACCDACIDGFLTDWPNAYTADKNQFQRNSIDVEMFYDGSRMARYYTKDEYLKYLTLILCPRCGSQVKHRIYAYNLPFDIVKDFESNLAELTSISNSFPYLFLDNEFAKSIYETIKELFKEARPYIHEKSLFRARVKETLISIDVKEFGFPPKESVYEGRYNNAGMPVLYLGDDPETCFYEMRERGCVIAEIKLAAPIKVLDLFSPSDQHPKHSDLLNTLVFSALMSAKQSDNGWFKPKFVFSRFIKDCAKKAGFDAIKYPSTRCNHECYNLVIINENIEPQICNSIIRIFDYKTEYKYIH